MCIQFMVFVGKYQKINFYASLEFRILYEIKCFNCCCCRAYELPHYRETKESLFISGFCCVKFKVPMEHVFQYSYTFIRMKANFLELSVNCLIVLFIFRQIKMISNF